MPATKTPSNAATAEEPYKMRPHYAVPGGRNLWIVTGPGGMRAEFTDKGSADNHRVMCNDLHAVGRAAQLRELLPVLNRLYTLLVSGCGHATAAKESLWRIIADAEAK